MSEPFLIAGGGIAGLATAIALAQRGARSRILEREAEPPESGAGIQIGPNGTRVLNRLGVAPLLAPYVGAPQFLAVRDARSGRELTRMPLGDWIARRHGSPYWVAHRADLHRALRARAAAEPLIDLTADAAVVSVRQDDKSVTVSTATGDTVKGAALIGADGIRSAVRAFVAPSAITFAGRTASRTVVPAETAAPLFRQAHTGLWLSPGTHIVHYPVRGGTEVAVIVIVRESWQDEGWSAPVPDGEIARCGSGLAPELGDFLAGASGWRRWALFDAKPLSALSRGRIVLVGDAAHPILPFLAQGAVMALEDAVTLADAIAARGDDLPTAFRDFASARRARLRRVQAASRQNGVIYHLAGLPALARNATLKLAPPERLIAHYDWLYGWRAGMDT
jgi:salicylate hydroxylase